MRRVLGLWLCNLMPTSDAVAAAAAAAAAAATAGYEERAQAPGRRAATKQQHLTSGDSSVPNEDNFRALELMLMSVGLRAEARSQNWASIQDFCFPK